MDDDEHNDRDFELPRRRFQRMRFQRSCNELMGIAYGGFVKLRRFRALLLFFNGLILFTMRVHFTIKETT